MTEQVSDKQFADEVLASINKYRALHMVDPLVYSQGIESVSRGWAQHLAKSTTISHNPNPLHHGMQMGENIATRWSSDHSVISGSQAVDQWYDEINRYDFKLHDGPKTGHFTQVVWKGSKELGVWRAQAKDGTWIVVANFFPPGNYIGENAKNVFPPKNGKIYHAVKNGTPAGYSHDGKRGSTQRETRTETFGNVTKTTKTETVKGRDGAKTITVTEKTLGPGPVTKTKVTETIKKTDGSSTTRTTERIERGHQDESHDIARYEDLEDDQSDVDLAAFCRDVANSHNKYRRRHYDTGDLVLNDELTTVAQNWANYLAKTKSLQHSKSFYRGQPVGENVASKHGTGPVDYKGDEVVWQWYKEIEKYDYKTPFDAQSGTGTGHFTQVVWKDSSDIGVGKAFSDDNRVYVVALYHPAGNYIGRQNYERNVCQLRADD